jgi:MerR family mercuric resistance operon transcriptional regulator
VRIKIMDEGRSLGIGGLARRAGCSVETIRYYERIGLMPMPPRSGGRYRRYAAADLRRLRFLRRGRAFGFTLAEMRALLALAGAEESCPKARALAARHIATLRMKIAELSMLERTLSATVAGCADATAAGCPLIDALGDESAGG